MFVRTKKTPNSDKIAVQLVENKRVADKVKQTVIRHFGYALNQEEVNALTKLALRYKYESEQQESSQPNLFSTDSLIELISKASQKEDEPPAEANLKDIREENRMVVGLHCAYGKLFDEIGFGGVVKNPARKKASIRLLRDLVLMRIHKPASKLYSVSLMRDEFGVETDVNSIYRMMDYLDETAIDKTKQISYEFVRTLLEDELDIIFYDCTTLYFESFHEDEFRRNGYSKDMKFNQPQVLLGVIVTKSGLPISYELFEGNKFEGNTLEEAIKRLHERYKIGNVIFVADSGLLSHKNIKIISEKGLGFIVGARIKNLGNEIKEQILDKSGYKPLKDLGDVIYKEIELKEQGLRLIVNWSEDRAAKDKYDREKAIESLCKRFESGNNITSFLNNYGYKKYLKVEGRYKLIKDEEKIKEAERWDGLHGIITNIKPEKIDAETLLSQYRGLWQIEDTFRLLKHDLRIRPMFHWTKRRINAHVAICFMSLLCARVMEYRVALQYRKMSYGAINRHLQSLQTSIVIDVKTNKRYAIPSCVTQDAKKIYQILGLNWKTTPYEIRKK